MITRDEFIGMRHFPALDGVRALAVLMVMGWHARHSALSAANGDFGVTIFFVLSGFLITTLAIREELATGSFHFVPFTIRRFFRIAPLLWLGVAVYAVLIFGLGLDPRVTEYAHAIPFYLLYMGEWPNFTSPVQDLTALGPAPFDGVWSLGIEEKFYIFWPILAFVLLARRRGRGTLALVLAIALWVFGQFANPVISVWVVSYAPILLGCAVAMFVHHPSGYPIIQKAARPYVLYPMILALAVLIAFRLPSLGEAVKQILVAGVLVGVVLERRGIASTVLSWSPLRRIGVLSYALYLFHSLVFKTVDKFLPAGNTVALGLLSLAAGAAVAVATCEVLHRCYEKPIQQFGRRLASRFSTTGPTVTAVGAVAIGARR
jgi:peptidoglycan/LPS O-acetylase OafA/YrhL